MSDSAPIGPVDVAVLLFPEGRISAEVTAAFAETIASGAVRLLDELVIRKDANGAVEMVDVDDEGDTLTVLASLADHRGLLSEDDAGAIADELAPGSAAILVAWENMWAVRLRGAIFAAGGSIAAHERIDAATVAKTYSGIADVKERS